MCSGSWQGHGGRETSGDWRETRQPHTRICPSLCHTHTSHPTLGLRPQADRGAVVIMLPSLFTARWLDNYCHLNYRSTQWLHRTYVTLWLWGDVSAASSLSFSIACCRLLRRNIQFTAPLVACSIPNTVQNCSFYAPVFSSPLSTVHLLFSQLQNRYRTTSFRDDKSGRHPSTTDQSRQTSILNRRPFCLEQFASIS